MKLIWENIFHNKKWERLWYWKFYLNSYVWKILSNYLKKSVRCCARSKHRSSPPDVFLWKGVLSYMSQIYRITPILKRDFNHTFNHISAWVFSSKFVGYFSEHLFIGAHLEDCFCNHNMIQVRRMSKDCRIITHSGILDHFLNIPWK